MTVAIFWTLLVMSIYSYLLYPFLLMMWPARGRVRSISVGSDAVEMTVIVAARNEAERIGAKLEDVMNQDYPKESLEVIVVSDASEDGTDEIVQRFGDRRVRLVRKEDRQGKEAAQALAIAQSTGEILVFTDVATKMGAGSLRAIAEGLALPHVGAVSSIDRFEGDEGSGEGLYVRYEMALRALESSRGGLVGLSGSFFAVRRAVAENWRTDVPSDFTAALNSARLGLKSVSDSRVVGIYPDLKKDSDEFARKRRTAIRGMAALLAAPEVLNPARYGIFAFQVFSHKLMRWLVPWFLGGLLFLSVYLASSYWPARLALAGQAAFYAVAVIGWISPRYRAKTWCRIIFYFVQVNVALAAAFIDLCRGQKVIVWEPSKR